MNMLHMLMLSKSRKALHTGKLLLVTLLAVSLAACQVLPSTPATPIPPIITEAAPPAAFNNLAQLEAASIPPRDLQELTARLRGIDQVASVAAERSDLTVGDREPFWYKNHETDENVQITAKLIYRSTVLNLWLEEGIDLDQDHVAEAAQVLEAEILPTNHAFFGDPVQPGTASKPRLNILHLRNIGGNVLGYFSAADTFASVVNPFSNERTMFYVSLEQAPVGSSNYYQVIAHELEHMIQWYTDPNEATWLDEGMAVLAAALNGYGAADFDLAYAAQPDVQLNNFDYESDSTGAHYGASFLFASYFLDRFGEEATRALLQNPENGISGVESTLADLGQSLTFTDLFADWAAATYLDGAGLGSRLYGYQSQAIPPLAAVTYDSFPVSSEAAINQFGSDYLELAGTRPVTVVFTGTQQTRLLPTAAYSGTYLWSTVPADDSDMTLTGRFDLRDVDSATLSFWSWYDIEDGWDYAYILASADDGQSWQFLETEHTVRDNPQGNSFGPGLTGQSGENGPEWVQQRVNLAPFVGAPVLIRFEYVTDDAVHRHGLALDDIMIPEIGFSDDVESEEGIWEARGFVRHSNVLPQRFLVQSLLLDENDVVVTRLSVDNDQQGRWTIPLGANASRAVLVVSGTTPVTTLPASYAYVIAQ